jgi:hypothetical protein
MRKRLPLVSLRTVRPWISQALPLVILLPGLFFVLSATAQQPEAPLVSQTTQPPPSDDFKLDYTGALFGYYRIEPEARLVPTSRDGHLPVAGRFVGVSSQRRGPLLLGMGDNFAPEFGASIESEVLEGPCHMAATLPPPGRRFVGPRSSLQRRKPASSLRRLR